MSKSSSGSSASININPDEMTHIANELLAIAKEFETVIQPAVKQLADNKYLTAGNAKKAISKVPKANERVLELQDHYNTAAGAVFDVLQQMIDADKEIGEKIIGALDI